ncbi:hypothetical protein SCA03_59450 [Streptomyces cacaoi]|uniref:Uncharacterized protein n=1 Tax=Streptomyces cacaoi TaxID=1898 RepID=A0A4Y3R769_STRCI|nr:hypothetical protein SCA03_59450 [Streptomyces cacaoi]
MRAGQVVRRGALGETERREGGGRGGGSSAPAADFRPTPSCRPAVELRMKSAPVRSAAFPGLVRTITLIGQPVAHSPHPVASRHG